MLNMDSAPADFLFYIVVINTGKAHWDFEDIWQMELCEKCHRISPAKQIAKIQEKKIPVSYRTVR
jgi:hypothetical protein